MAETRQPRRASFIRSGRLIAVAAAVAAPAAAQVPLLQYGFNESGTSSSSSGSNATALSLLDGILAGSATDLHSAAGTGVSGGLGVPTSATDRAFQNTTPAGMGSAVGLGNSDTQKRGFQANNSAVNSLQRFTIAGWFKTDTTAPFQGAAALVDRIDFSGNPGFGPGFTLYGGSSGAMTFVVDPTNSGDFGLFTNVGAYVDTEKWVFFAVSYDGNATTNNVHFYKGYRNAAEAPGGNFSVFEVPAFNNVQTLNRGPVDSGNAPLLLGNRDNNHDGTFDKPFDGFLDNFRLFGTQTPNDPGGLLTRSQLEALRAADVVGSLRGDANHDGTVNTADFGILAASFNQTTALVWANGQTTADFNADGKINGLDFNAIASNFGLTSKPSPALGALVPEPASVAFLAAIGAITMRRRNGLVMLRRP